MRLSYFSAQKKRQWNEKRIGFHNNTPAPLKPRPPVTEGEVEGEIPEDPRFYRGVLLATDIKGRLYFYDPVSNERLLRAFNTQGKEVERWTLPPQFQAIRAATTLSGMIWVNVKDQSLRMTMSPKPGLPFIAFKMGVPQPQVNWLQKMPREILLPLQQQLQTFQQANGKVKPEQKSTFLTVSDPLIQAGRDGVRLYLYNFGGNDNLPRLYMTADVKGNGKVVDATFLSETWKNVVASLSPLGENYYVSSDSTPTQRSWTKVWLSKSKTKRGEPLLTTRMLENPSGWWVKKLGTNSLTQDVAVSLNGNDNIYLIFHKQGTHPDSLFLPSGNAPMRFAPPQEYAVVVLNSKRQVVSYLPWKTTYLRPDDEWILPVPDGSGFYRQEFGEKSLNIYWHPLPNFKPKGAKR